MGIDIFGIDIMGVDILGIDIPALPPILNGYTQVNIKILLIQTYHTTCVSFSCEFI